MAEQAALYEFTERLHRARSVDDVYESALDAIIQALGCCRASILLFDEAGQYAVCRLARAVGRLSARRWTDIRHGPPTRTDPMAIFIDDVASADLPEALKAIVKAEGIGALAFIPLVAGGKLIGKFMTYYDAPHAFDEARGRSGADHCPPARLQRGADARGRARFAHSEQRLQMALKAGRMGAWEWNIGTGKVIWSPGLEELHGLRPGTFGGTFEDFKRDMHPDDVPLCRSADPAGAGNAAGLSSGLSHQAAGRRAALAGKLRQFRTPVPRERRRRNWRASAWISASASRPRPSETFWWPSLATG